jgi:hypothetical protein
MTEKSRNSPSSLTRHLMILRCHPARTMDGLGWRMAIRASTYICPPGGRLILALRLSFATLEWIVLGDEPAAAVLVGHNCSSGESPVSFFSRWSMSASTAL